MSRASLASLVLVLGACAQSTTATDSGTSGTDSGSGDAVAQCQALVDRVTAACMAEAMPPAERLCIYQNYRAACATGRTSVVAAMMSCLLMDGCQTLSDPSAAATCVAGVVAASTTPAHQMLGAEICTCDPTQPGCPAYPQFSGAELLVVADADATAVTTCLQGLAVCSPATATPCYMSVPYGAAYLACVAP